LAGKVNYKRRNERKKEQAATRRKTPTNFGIETSNFAEQATVELTMLCKIDFNESGQLNLKETRTAAAAIDDVDDNDDNIKV